MQSAVAASVHARSAHLDHLDGLRALAALYVTIFHMWWYTANQMKPSLGKHVIGVFAYGHYAVVVFIVLSGFCLMLPVIRNGFAILGGSAGFFWKRARRILPPYYAAVCLSLLLIACVIKVPPSVLWSSCVPVGGFGLVTHLLLFQDLFPASSHKINHAMWSISVEWRIYFAFPLFVAISRAFGVVKATAVFVCLSFALLPALALTALDSSPTGVCLHFYGLFALGSLGSWMSFSSQQAAINLRTAVPWRALFPALAVATLLLSKLSFGHEHQVPWQVLDLLAGLGTFCLLVGTSALDTEPQCWWLRKVLCWPPLVWVGAFSYSLYLIHAPLIEVLWQRVVLPGNSSPFAQFCIFCGVGLPVLLLLAYLFHLFFERPFTRRRDQRAFASALSA